MEPYFDHTIPTEVVTGRNIRILVALIAFWALGALIPLIFWPTSYAAMAELEHKKFPESEKYKFDRHLFSNEVYAYIDKFTKFYSHKAEIFNLEPPTYEGRRIRVMRLKFSNSEDQPKKGRILVTGGMWACLWDSVSATIDLMHKLLEECCYKIPFLLEYDWYIIPIVNPDGYDYSLSMRDKNPTRGSNPKNRNPNRYPDNHQYCHGVYLDRNFAFHWGESKPEDYNFYCWIAYAGPHPFSENETRAIASFMHSLALRNERITMYLQLHGSQSRDDITYPWRFTRLATFNQPVLHAMAKAAAAEVDALTGITFTYRQGGKRDLGSGVFVDWLTGIMHILYNFSIEPTFETKLNSTDVPDQRIYIEKVITIVFALVKQLRFLESSANCLIFHQTYLLFFLLPFTFIIIDNYCI